MPKKPFKGVIKLDVRDSTPDWEPYIPPRAPEGAPNILFILYDDTGLATWSPFGGKVNMPTYRLPKVLSLIPSPRLRGEGQGEG